MGAARARCPLFAFPGHRVAGRLQFPLPATLARVVPLPCHLSSDSFRDRPSHGVFRASPQPPAWQPAFLGPGTSGSCGHPARVSRLLPWDALQEEAQRGESLLGTHVPTRQGFWQADPCPPPAPQTSGHRLELHACRASVLRGRVRWRKQIQPCGPQWDLAGTYWDLEQDKGFEGAAESGRSRCPPEGAGDHAGGSLARGSP